MNDDNIIVYRNQQGAIVVSIDGGETVFEPMPTLYWNGGTDSEPFDPARHRRVWASGPDA